MLQKIMRTPSATFFKRLCSASSCIGKYFEKHAIIPDVIEKVPEILAKITYPCGVKVDLGDELTPTQAKHIPFVRWKANNKNYYTLCMIDPDAPSRREPDVKEWMHWLVVNIPGCIIDDGETLTAYVGAGPPKGTGLHRYVFLVYKQKCKMDFNELCINNTCPKGRSCFSIKKFAKKYELGQPVAGNFFQAQWDNYVPLFNKQLGLDK